MKRITSRYSLTEINNDNLKTIEISGTNSYTSGYIWMPFIIQQTGAAIIDSKSEIRKRKISAIINKI